MREILFRAKRDDTGEWVYGMPARQPDGAIREIEHLNHDKLTNGVQSIEYIEVKEETICQYTGMKDKNGRKIFESDIIKCGKNLVVTWNEELSAWCLTKRGCIYSYFFVKAYKPENCEVIGDIFDNPELLKGEDET